MKIKDVDEEIRELVKAGMIKRAEAYALEQKAKALKGEADDILLPLLVTIEDGKVDYPKIGAVTHVVTERKSLDRDKFKLQLVKKGVKTTIVEAAEAIATTKKCYDSVRFSKPKAKTK